MGTLHENTANGQFDFLVWGLDRIYRLGPEKDCGDHLLDPPEPDDIDERIEAEHRYADEHEEDDVDRWIDRNF